MQTKTKPSIYLFWGDDGFSIRERLVFWKNEFIKKYGGQTLWSQDVSSVPDVAAFEQQLRTAFRSATLFAQPRLTILKNCDELSPSALEMTASLLASIPDTHFVVLTAKKYDKKKPLYATLESLQKKGRALVQECCTPTGTSLAAWVKKRLSAKGKKMDTQTLELFLSCVTADADGGMNTIDLDRIANEIDKMCSYTCVETITKQDIRIIVSGTEIPRIFELEDAILQQERERALRLTHVLTTQRKERGKNAFLGIVTFLGKEMRALLLIQAGHQPKSWSPQRMWHAKRKIGSRGADQLRSMYKNLLASEQILKSSSLNAGMIVDSFVVRATLEDPRLKSVMQQERKAR